jgi:lysophospholipase L1-like esterase
LPSFLPIFISGAEKCECPNMKEDFANQTRASRTAYPRNARFCIRLKRCLILLVSKLGLPLTLSGTLAAMGSTNLINTGFEDGLNAWRLTGDVKLETAAPMEGKTSLNMGPGVGSVAQRVTIGSGEHLWVSVAMKSDPPGAGKLIVRYLAKDGRELMRLDSAVDIKHGDKQQPGKLSFYMKEHPLTEDVEVIIAKENAGGYVLADNVEFKASHDNSPELQPRCNLDEFLRSFWQGNKVYCEPVLMFSENGQPASGRLMFQPTRILAVQNYGQNTNYAEGHDYTVAGRELICTPASHMTQVRDSDLIKGELNWNKMIGKQVVVTYEHEDSWAGPVQTYVGDQLPNTIKKLRARAPLTVVAYGDSITHGFAVSRLMNIPPFMPPYPELFVRRLKQIYQDEQITLYNSAQSGATSDWGARLADRMVASLNPDLVTIAFGQNDFWGISPDTFAKNISTIIHTVRLRNPQAEFLLVSTLRFDPAYTTNTAYWKAVGEYAGKLKSLTGPGVQLVDMTAISEAIYLAKKPKDCLNDPLHPNDFLARWYAQSLVAALTPTVTDAVSSSGSLKKGVGQNGRNESEAVDALGCSWYYNWSAIPDKNIRAEFVPMIWDGKQLDERLAAAKATGATALLGFNEPDNEGQANMTVAKAVALWPKLMATGMRLGSPAPKDTGHWLADFMTEAKARNLRVDFLCLHWYGDITKPGAVKSLRAYLEDYWNRYHLPIWLTEFSGADFEWHLRRTTVEDNATFATAAAAMLETLPFVERYAWFAVQPQGKDYSKVGLFDADKRMLTPVGIAYRDAQSLVNYPVR